MSDEIVYRADRTPSIGTSGTSDQRHLYDVVGDYRAAVDAARDSFDAWEAVGRVGGPEWQNLVDANRRVRQLMTQLGEPAYYVAVEQLSMRERRKLREPA